MSFDIFGPSQKDAISVGYISTDRGYIQNVNVKDANLYAQKNPGTQFIFTTRNFVKYLNINEVNKLTPDDLLVDEKTCEGIVIEKEGGPAKALFYGGGGVGAQGNPIIGTDGAVLAIDLIAGGFGYQYEPIVVVKDDTGVGAGAVIRAVLGEVIETVEYFDQESDFEIYDTGGSNTGSGTGSGDGGYNTGASGAGGGAGAGGGTGAGSGGSGDGGYNTGSGTGSGDGGSNTGSGTGSGDGGYNTGSGGSGDATLSLFGSEGPPAALGSAEVDAEYGLRYDASGNILGKWDPTLYTNLDKDPIRKEIQKYQDFIQKIGNAWWTTRKNPPIVVTSRYRTSKIIYNVTDATYLELYKKRGLVNITGWSDFLNTYAVSPVSPSNVPGSDFAGIEFTLEWEELFPYDGEYVFRAQADNIGRFYLDNQKILETTEFRQDQTPKIIKKTIKAGVHRIRIDLYNSPVIEKVVKNQAVQPVNDNYPCPGTKDMRGYNDYPGTLEGQSNQFGLDNDYPSAKSQGFTDADIRCYLEKIYLKIPGKRLGPKMQEVLKDPTWGVIGSIPLQKPYTIKTSYSGLNAVKNNFKAGIYKISASYYQSTGPSGIAIIIKNKASGKLVFDSLKNIGGANIKLLPVVKNILGGETASSQYKLDNFGNNSEESKIFLRNSGVFPENVKDNSTTNIEWKNIYFTEDGEYEISVSVDDSITIDITAESGLVPLNPLPTSNSIKSTGSKTKKIFNTVDYIDKSDRKLWRFDPRAGRDSEFINQYGILPFDPNSESAKIESFSGIHVIRWQFVEFPVDGNYNVEIMVDDSVVVYIGNRDGSGRQEIGNGLTDINEGGDETIFRKSGSGKSFETRYFKSGKYRIRVELEQSNLAAKIKDMRGYNDYPGTDQGAPNQFGYLNDYPSARSQGFTDADIRYYLEKVYKGNIGPDMKRVLSDSNWGRQGLTALALGNPMGFAMNIEVTFTEDEVISSKSWNENPMGVALIIDAPNPPIPQEPIPLQEGRCPRNPIWTTRFPGAKEQWIPVNYVAKDSNQVSWSSFTNRFAISPVRPLSTPGSDSGGIVYKNSWNLDLPYDGFYAFKSTVDNAGRILIDGIAIMQANYIPTVYKNTKGGSGQEQRSGISAIDDGIIYNWRNNNPKSKKIFLTKGVHKIEVEVENGITESFAIINKKIFSTSDWLVSPPPQNIIVDVDFNIKAFGSYSSTFEIKDLGINLIKPIRSTAAQVFSNKVQVGKVYTIEINVPQSVDGVRLEIKGQLLEMEEQKSSSPRDIFCTISKGRFFNVKNGEKKATCNFIVDAPSTIGTSKDGVTYEGPTAIANYVTTSYGYRNNRDFISPLLQDINAFPNDEIQGKTWVFRWSKVNFPEDGEYKISIESDDNVVIFIGNNSKNGEIEINNGLYDINKGGDENIFSAKLSKLNNPGKSLETRFFKAGKYRIRVELTNSSLANTGFLQNPTYFTLNITKGIRSSTGLSYSWTQNPMGIAAIMIPPPCPKIIKGKGVVTKIIVDDPGNSYPPPPSVVPSLPAALEPAAVSLPPDKGPLDRYPVCLILDEVIVEDSGINYNCGVDKLQIIPDNGVILDYNCDTFGRISEVKILNNGTCFSSYPNIFLPTDTGINATFRPVFRVVRDPVDLDLKDKLIQVTDLVGLKLTGYLEGRPYYGAVFYDNDIRFAGYYKTIGKPLQIYDTLQESIDSQVVTPPSAIQRQGTDISSNDPRLNIPGTPGEII